MISRSVKKHEIRKYIEYSDAIGYCYFRGTEELIICNVHSMVSKVCEKN
jgi:hypothetical protein